ncbi:MAG: DUF4920 domain-containing protein [Ginsengibacter sp.]|jgi:hypothetical protein
MKKITLTLIAFVSFCLVYAQPPAGNAIKGDLYGAPITEVKTIKKSQLKSLESGVPVTGLVEGKVIEVCKNKGCWMKVELADKSVATVKMKDYGFFVPTALEGKKVIVYGNVELATTSVKELQHFAEDAKKSAEEIASITQPKNEIKILASGIRVIK